MLYLYLEAPFATFRTFTAGSFRPTAEFITPSAAYGLLLNIAGIEMRRHEDGLPMTTIRNGLPRFRLSLGAISLPSVHSIYQQLHNYPVGNTGKETPERANETAERAKGNKYNITPTRRAFLSDLKAYICLDSHADLENQIKSGLSGSTTRTYGLPFLGDNNFLISKLEPVTTLLPARWFERIASEQQEGLRKGVTRLTISIDRKDMSRTHSAIFAPLNEPSTKIPEKAWVEVGY